MKKEDFIRFLGDWYEQNRRDLPWRKENRAYAIWLSEVILQQTRVNQGLPYYHRFLEAFPELETLAEASEDQVLLLWQGLGYYSRARNLLAAARQLKAEYPDGFPLKYDKLIKIKGIGEYTAAAIASIAGNEAVAAVDGNVYRVLSRFEAIEIPCDTQAGKKYFRSRAEFYLDPKNPGRHNQAMMELGALLCTPKKPRCEECPLQSGCQALQDPKGPTAFPIKSKKKASPEVFLHYLVFVHENETLIERRNQAGIWKGLYQFPLIETAIDTEIPAFNEHPVYTGLNAANQGILISSFTLRHVLTHRRLLIRFHLIKVPLTQPSEGLEKVAMGDLRHFAMPVPLQSFISKWLIPSHSLEEY